MTGFCREHDRYTKTCAICVIPRPPMDTRWRRTADGGLEVWDIDEDWWPDGLWMRICVLCLAGPMNDGEIQCPDHELQP